MGKCQGHEMGASKEKGGREVEREEAVMGVVQWEKNDSDLSL